MTEVEKEEREKAVAEALSWEKTPFHDCARLKHVGVDCANYVYEAFHNVKLVDDFVIPYYTEQFLLHSEEELFLEIVELFCKPVTHRDPLPGDLMMFKYGRCFSHSALVIEWPQLIHARKLAGMVVQGNYEQDTELQLIGKSRRPMKLYTLKRWS